MKIWWIFGKFICVEILLKSCWNFAYKTIRWVFNRFLSKISTRFQRNIEADEFSENSPKFHSFLIKISQLFNQNFTVNWPKFHQNCRWRCLLKTLGKWNTLINLKFYFHSVYLYKIKAVEYSLYHHLRLTSSSVEEKCLAHSNLPDHQIFWQSMQIKQFCRNFNL